MTDNFSVRICANKVKSRITFKIEEGNYLELLTPETMKLLGSTQNKITKVENGENVPHLEITEAVLVHCNIVNNNYQKYSRVLHTFISFISSIIRYFIPKFCIFQNITFDSKFSYIKVWFTDQKSKPLEIEDKINITVVNK